MTNQEQDFSRKQLESREICFDPFFILKKKAVAVLMA